MKKKGSLFSFLGNFLTAILLGSCTSGETPPEGFPEENTEIALYIDNGKPTTRAPGDTIFSVDRLLILPLRKSNPGGTDDPSNYVPVYDKAQQIDVISFPVATQVLALPATDIYQLLIIGYNRKDYDFANPAKVTRRFNIGSASSPASLANLYLQPVNAADVPEFFVCMGEGYKNTSFIGTHFTPREINHVKGTLKRIVGGLTLAIDMVPTSVSGLSLTAEQLVTSVRAFDGMPLTWQTAGDSGNKLIGTRTPAAGKVVFSTYMLPTPDARKTLFYLDIHTGAATERFTMKVADSPGVATGNRIIFSPNHWVNITGKYTDIKPGFFISGTINLDDNAWDGIQ